MGFTPLIRCEIWGRHKNTLKIQFEILCERKIENSPVGELMVGGSVAVLLEGGL